MASIPLTLAALATSAVPGLNVVGTQVHSSHGAGNFSSAHLTTEDQEVLIRVPKTPQAEVQISAEILGLAALSDGARESLPVEIPVTLGMTRAGDTRAVVSTYIDGDRVDVHSIATDALLLQSLSEFVAAVHQLPVGLVSGQGLPVRSSGEVRVQAKRLIDRAAATHLLPETVHQSWLQAVNTEAMWDFEPCVIHGTLSADQLRVRDDTVVGVLGWDGLAISDPASDFTWLLASGRDTCEAVLARYAALRGVAGTNMLRARAMFYHQLEVAQWLLHGVDTHDNAVISDAVSMLDRMVDRLEQHNTAVVSRPLLNTSEVSALLDEVPQALPDPRSETAEYDSLDEDRMFEWGVEETHEEPLTAAAIDRSSTATQSEQESSANSAQLSAGTDAEDSAEESAPDSSSTPGTPTPQS